MICHTIDFVIVMLTFVRPNNNYKRDSRSSDVHKQFLMYRQISDNKEGLSYQPIRIHPVFKDIYFELSATHMVRLSKAVNSAVYKISQLLSVFPVKQAMLLKRSGCYKEWTVGSNKGRCLSVKRFYGSEICMDTYVIPDDHLDGLYVWNETSPEPIEEIYPPGHGINNTDFVLYVESLTTEACGFSSFRSVLSYARVCRVDQHDRPIAGYINLCPQELMKSSQEKLYKTLIHELFHTLGFSKAHFDYFKKCFINNNTIECHPLNLVKVREVNSVVRMVTPAVLREAQNHFGCYSETKFGAPLDGRYMDYTSHWDSRLMYGSIMAPKIGQPHLTLIDRMTLAVFEDSGWYKVNYNNADTYLWGRHTGCSTKSDFCLQNNDYICKNNSRGCHYLHKDKGWCEIDRNTRCGIYQTELGNDCVTLPVTGHEEEIYGNSSACFVSNLTKNTLNNLMTDGRCYLYKCSKSRNLEIKVQGAEWMDCPFNQWINISGYNGYIKCPPSKDILCPEPLPVDTTTNKMVTTTSINNVIFYTSTHPGLTQQEDNNSQTRSSAIINNFSCYFILFLLILICTVK